VNFLLDTDVVSEWAKPRPDTGVVAWLSEPDEDRVFISVITLAELRHGIERLPAGARRDLARYMAEPTGACPFRSPDLVGRRRDR
jgi:predicted nucleic acid-binding protein